MLTSTFQHSACVWGGTLSPIGIPFVFFDDSICSSRLSSSLKVVASQVNFFPRLSLERNLLFVCVEFVSR